jgi:hypothetical protein
MFLHYSIDFFWCFTYKTRKVQLFCASGQGEVSEPNLHLESRRGIALRSDPARL